MSLLEDLKAARVESNHGRVCPLCEYIATIDDDETREALIEASAPGNIGRDKLVAVLAKNKTGIGHRTIRRHRQEGHTP